MNKILKFALISLAAIGLSFQASAKDEDVSLYIYNSNLGTPIEFGKIPWDAMVYDYTGSMTNVCPCMSSTNKYYYVGRKAHSVAFGKEVEIEGRHGASPEDAYTSLVGAQSSSVGYGNAIVGHMTSVTGDCATVVGRAANVDSYFGAVALGFRASTKGGYAPIAIGCDSVATGDSGSTASPIAIGVGAKANGNGALAIGLKAKATGRLAVQIGNGNNETARTVKIGNAYFVDVSGTANRMVGSLDSISDVAGLKAWLAEFCNRLTVPYELDDVPDTDENFDPDYRTLLTRELVDALAKVQQFDEVNSLAAGEPEPVSVKSETSPTWNDVIQYIIMAILTAVVVIRKKKDAKKK